MRLATFIIERMEDILKEWEAFARSIQPGEAMNTVELRDHAEARLKVIAADLKTSQTERESVQKSQGNGVRKSSAPTAAESHAGERLRAGFSTELLVSEYRALRASVLRLWLKQSVGNSEEDANDMIRFNEAIDQALAESVESYSQLVKEAQDIFLGILGHDLRSPLQSVSIGAAYLMRSETADSRLIQLGARMYNSAVRMSEMLDDLLDYTKLRIGAGLPVTLQESNLALVCAQVIDEFRASHPGRLIHVVTTGDCSGIFDGRRIGQVYQNLLGNALQYSASQSIIEITLSGNAEDVIFTIRNQGKVIPDTEQRNLFDPLRRHDAGDGEDAFTNRNLGLGLYIAREVVAAHAGKISLTSIEGEGTTFKVVLPKGSADANSAMPLPGIRRR